MRTVQLYLQISLTSIYKLIHQGEIPAVKLGTKTIRVNRKALMGYLERAAVRSETAAA
ncbi:MAG: helix-turn-helix domain-containing protein [Clostridiales bacterium]|nr:helix-turn-helix domain-containing protein [Eggerthellaceae bacterium]MBR4615407.1 helix-turn-helix domain-containing protein [Kiritimatiellia bacterium]NLD30615.1 helix-turn-helix domain-containing protein [Clostridiales bacterium]